MCAEIPVSAQVTGAETPSYTPASGSRELRLRDGEAVAAPRCKEGSQARQQWKNFRYNLDNTITLAGRNSLWPDEHYLIYQSFVRCRDTIVHSGQSNYIYKCD